MKNIELIISPYDQRGNKVASYYHTMFSNIPDKMRPDDYNYTFK